MPERQKGRHTMAAVKTLNDRKLIVVVSTGETKNGKDLTKNMTFSKIKNDATDEALLTAGKAIASLQTRDLASLKLNEYHSLTEGT